MPIFYDFGSISSKVNIFSITVRISPFVPGVDVLKPIILDDGFKIRTLFTKNGELILISPTPVGYHRKVFDEIVQHISYKLNNLREVI
jgi:hypothetical protein